MTIAGDLGLDEDLFALFAQQAARRPDAIAIVDDSGATTYGALLSRARVIADALTERGLRAEQPVGVLMHRTSELLATLLGILEAGGCYVPLDPDDPPERARRIVDGARCQLVLGHATLLEELRSRLIAAEGPTDSAELVDIDRFTVNATSAASSEAAKARPRFPDPGGRRLAYILFTSGSTGTPKGVEVEHCSVVNLLLAARDLFGFTESDRYLATSTIGFDISVSELFLPLITGGVVVLRERQLVLDPRRLVEVIRSQGVTVFQTGPSVWSVLLAEVPEFPRLRVAVSTGEAIAPELAQRMAAVGEAVWNLYGPTEATVWATGHRLDRDAVGVQAGSSVSAPIGRPLDNVVVRVLDEHRAPVPPGVEGELWIGGKGLARGYCGNEALTQERFVDLGEGRGRFFRTGDVVAQDGAGSLHYFGRNDDQIKVRGVRIEPMEVESAILAHPGVTRTAATWFATASGFRSIVAAVVVRPGSSISASDLHHFLVPVLPTAMIPSRFVFCDTLPSSQSGKIDRQAIRARATGLPADPAAVPGRDALSVTERTLAGIWERTLNIRPIGRGDHFFTIGGDSLSAVTMMLEVEAAFDVSLAFRVAFDAPTLTSLAERIDIAQAEKLATQKAPIPTDDLGNAAFVFPLTQEGRGTPVFFNAVNLRLAHKGIWNLDCPLYAVSYWAQGSGFAKAKSLEELARIQIDGIRSVQPHGPYRLAGYSFGGLVMLEIAHQLRRSGETIELLFLLDPSEPTTDGYTLRVPAPGDPESGASEGLGARINRHWKHLKANPRRALPYLLTRAFPFIAIRLLGPSLRPVREWISYHLVHFYGRHPNPISARLLPKNRWPAFWYTAKRLGMAYTPQSFDGEVLAMFISHQERREMWKELLCPSADIRTIDSEHLGMFAEPALSMWLQPLRARLERDS